MNPTCFLCSQLSCSQWQATPLWLPWLSPWKRASQTRRGQRSHLIWERSPESWDSSHRPVLRTSQGRFSLSLVPCATHPVGLQMPVGQNGPGPGSGGHSCVYCCVERRWGPREGWASFWWRWACVTDGSKLMSTLPALAQPFRAPRTDEGSSEDGLMLRMVLCLWTVGSNRVFSHLLWLVPGFSRTSRHPESAEWDAWFRCFTENSAIVKRTLGLQHCRLNSTSSPLYFFFCQLLIF